MADAVLQKAGEECPSCKSRWEKAKKPGVKLIEIPGTTKQYRTRVVICPYCDGPIADIARETARRRAENDSGS